MRFSHGSDHAKKDVQLCAYVSNEQAMFAGILTCTSHSWRIFLSPEEALFTAADSSPFSIAETMRRALWTLDVSSICLVEAWVACWGWQKDNMTEYESEAGPCYGHTGKNITYPHNVSQHMRTQGDTYCLLTRNQLYIYIICLKQP